MLSTATDYYATARFSQFAGSRKDFVQAVRALIANTVLGHRLPNPSPNRGERALLSCSREHWLRVVGLEHRATLQYDRQGNILQQAWQYDCTDGVVFCAGYQHGGSTGDTWMTLEAMYFL